MLSCRDMNLRPESTYIEIGASHSIYNKSKVLNLDRTKTFLILDKCSYLSAALDTGTPLSTYCIDDLFIKRGDETGGDLYDSSVLGNQCVSLNAAKLSHVIFCNCWPDQQLQEWLMQKSNSQTTFDFFICSPALITDDPLVMIQRFKPDKLCLETERAYLNGNWRDEWRSSTHLSLSRNLYFYRDTIPPNSTVNRITPFNLNDAPISPMETDDSDAVTPTKITLWELDFTALIDVGRVSERYEQTIRNIYIFLLAVFYKYSDDFSSDQAPLFTYRYSPRLAIVTGIALNDILKSVEIIDLSHRDIVTLLPALQSDKKNLISVSLIRRLATSRETLCLLLNATQLTYGECKCMSIDPGSLSKIIKTETTLKAERDLKQAIDSAYPRRSDYWTSCESCLMSLVRDIHLIDCSGYLRFGAVTDAVIEAGMSPFYWEFLFGNTTDDGV